MRSRILANPLFASFLMVGLAGLASPCPAGVDCLPYGSFPRITATYADVHPTEMAALDDRHIVGLQGGDLVILGGDALPEYETLVRLTVSASATLNQLALVGTLVYCVNGRSGAVYAFDVADPAAWRTRISRALSGLIHETGIPRSGHAHLEVAAHEVMAVEAGNGLAGVRLQGHLHEAGHTGCPGFVMHGHPGPHDLALCGEEFLKPRHVHV